MEPALRNIGDASERICQPGLRIDVVQLFLRNQFGIATEQLKETTGEAAAAPKDISKEEPDLI